MNDQAARPEGGGSWQAGPGDAWLRGAASALAAVRCPDAPREARDRCIADPRSGCACRAEAEALWVSDQAGGSPTRSGVRPRGD